MTAISKQVVTAEELEALCWSKIQESDDDNDFEWKEAEN